MNILRLLILFISSAFCAVSQQPYYQWGHSFGTENYEGVRSIAVDEDENVYITGSYSDTIDLDPGVNQSVFPNYSTYSLGAYDIYLLKLDSLGDYVWAKTIGTQSTEHGYSVIYDSTGFIYISGTISSYTNVDQGASNTSLNIAGFHDVFVQKLDLDGNHIWSKGLHGKGIDYVGGLDLDQSGDIIVTGEIGDTMWFDSPYTDSLFPENYPYSDAFVVKMSKVNGSILWSKVFGGNNNVAANSVAVDYNNDIIISGWFIDTCDLNPDDSLEYLVAESNDRSPFVVKLSNNGDFIWGKAMPSSGGTPSGSLGGAGLSLAISTNNDIYVAGRYSDTIDFDPNQGSVYLNSTNPSGGTDWDGYLLKLNSSGDFNWVNSLRRHYSHDYISEIKIDSDQNIFLIGRFEDSALFYFNNDTILFHSEWGSDIFCAKVDSLGNYLWSITFGSNNMDYATCMNLGEDNAIFLGGRLGFSDASLGLADLDPSTNQDTVSLLGHSDFFIVRLNECIDSIGAAPVPLTATLPDVYAECSVNLTKPSAYHSCAGLVLGKTVDSIYYYSAQGSYVIEWVYDDGYGNTVSQFQNVFISDTISPVPIMANLPDVFASCDTTIFPPFAIDNCLDTIQATTLDPITFSNQGLFAVTWVFDDQNGNQTIQNQSIFILDSIAPIPDSIVLTPIFSQCPPVTLIAPTAQDNCNGMLTATANDSITYYDEGIYAVTWEFEDSSGNSTFQTQGLQIELIDSTISINSDTLYSNAIGNYIYQWMNCSNGSPIIGANQSFYAPGDNGSYSVNVYNGVCSLFSNCVDLSQNSTNFNQFAQEFFEVFPNPVQDKLTFRCSSTFVNSAYSICDVFGRQVKPLERIRSIENTTDVSNFQAGVYYIRINGSILKRFVKE